MPSSLILDVRLAIRAMVREKAFTTTALVSLALGIGVNGALFAVVSGVLLKPLPYSKADEIVRLSEFHPGGASAASGPRLTSLTYHAWKEATTLSDLGAFRSVRVTETSGPESVKIAGISLTPSTFRVLGVRPAQGRLFNDADALENAPGVVVISDGLWRERFGAEPSVVGRSLILDARPHTIVGITPPEFYFPDRGPRIFTPYRVPTGSTDPARPSVYFLSVIGRLRSKVTPQQAAEEGTALARGQIRPPTVDAVFGKGGPVTVRVDRLLDEITAPVRPSLTAFGLSAVFVLLMACSNVASLLLTRGVSRHRELAVRASLGASRQRLATQLIVESLVLVTSGGVAGLCVFFGLVSLIPVFAPRGFPRLADIAVDGWSILFIVLVTGAAGAVSGVLPALRASRSLPATALRDGSGASTGAATQRLRTGLVVLEVALAMALLVGAGLLFRSFAALMSVDPGYDTDGVLLVRVDPSDVETDSVANRQTASRIVARVEALPGVLAVGAASMVPFDPLTAIRSFRLPEGVAGGGEIEARAAAYTVSPGVAEALALRVKQGRKFGPADVANGIEGLMVNEEFVRSYMTDGRPVVGRRIPGLVDEDPEALTEIVGVVQNLLKNSLDQKPLSEIFSLARPDRDLSDSFYVVVRTRTDPSALASFVRLAVREIDPRSAVEITTLAERLEASVAQPRFAAWTVGVLALVSLVLSAVGLYGAISYDVSLRTREFGVRVALGASRVDILRLVCGQGLRVVAIGLVLGLGGAAATSKLISSLLFGVTALDPVVYLIAPGILLISAALACLVPAWRGASIEATEALRCE